MGHSHGANRHEASLCPARLDDYMAGDHSVGCFDAVADVADDHRHAVKAWLKAGITPSGSRPLTSTHGREVGAHDHE